MLENTETLLPTGTNSKLKTVSVGEDPESLDELERLLATLGTVPAGRILVTTRNVNPATYIGKGKIDDVLAMITDVGADAAILDMELTPNQLRNLEKALGKPVLDRPGVIIDIFSRHARTKESKTQVALARLQYLLPRLAHFWSHFERQRGGSPGSRGMGEKQIEVDRRLVKKRISVLRDRLGAIERERAVQRAGRKDILKVALVGYTNAGKSTLLNALTHSAVRAEDKLFATLDASVRAIDPDCHPPIVAIDTVGFISRLPPSLVASFRSTLEELEEADLLLHVVDASSTQAREQLEVTEKVLEELGVASKPRVTVLNKADCLNNVASRNRARVVAPGALLISAMVPADVKKLRDQVLDHFRKKLALWEVVIPYSESKMEAQIHAHGSVETTRHLEKGTFFRLRIEDSWAKKLGLGKFKLSLLAAFVLGVSAATPARADLDLNSQMSFINEPLTTSMIWKLDPGELHPHRSRWALERKVELLNLKTRKIRAQKDVGERVGVEASALVASSRYFVRGLGPWYFPLVNFSCGTVPDSFFATLDGTKVAADAAAREWERLLKEAKNPLALQLSRVSEQDPAQALRRGNDIFQGWLADLEAKWRREGRKQARAMEWQHYLGEATQGGICEKPAPALRLWSEMMEPAPATPISVRRLVARSPARRWDGHYSIRMRIKMGGNNLEGQFLVDPLAPHSLISPTFLKGQGILPIWAEVPGAPLVQVNWFSGDGLARPVEFEGIQIGNHLLSQRSLFMRETLFFEPPKTVASCCDGVVGADILRLFAVEFSPGHPPVSMNEVRFWPRDTFAFVAGSSWIETALTEKGALDPGQLKFDLLEHASYALDFSNGRIWFSPPAQAALKNAPLKNTSGLHFEFVFVRAARVLRVIRVDKGSPAGLSLARAGLKSSMLEGKLIDEIDSEVAGDLDLWEVEQRFAGAYGPTVSLQWKSPVGPRRLVIPVKGLPRG